MPTDHSLGAITSEQYKSLQRKAIRNVAAFIMLKFFIAIFTNKTARSLDKRVNAKYSA